MSPLLLPLPLPGSEGGGEGERDGAQSTAGNAVRVRGSITTPFFAPSAVTARHALGSAAMASSSAADITSSASASVSNALRHDSGNGNGG